MKKSNQYPSKTVNNAKRFELKVPGIIYNTFQENSFDNSYHNLSTTKYFVIKGLSGKLKYFSRLFLFQTSAKKLELF